MVRIRSVQIVFILVFFLSTLVFGQDKQDEQDKRLREEILSIYKSKGEQGLRDFVKKQKDKISNKFIGDFAEAGVKERKEVWLKISLFLAEEKKDEKVLADALYNRGEYFRLISDNKKAMNYFEKALIIYLKLNDSVGQGNVYLGKGAIFSYLGDNVKASEMYENALTFFVKANELVGQGKVYLREGIIHYYRGNNPRALEMYDKALTFFKKVGDLLSQGKVYLKKGIICHRTGDNTSALELYGKALLLFKKTGDSKGQGDVYRSKGDIYSRAGNNSIAIDMYDKALSFFDKAKDPIGQGNTYLGKGKVYYSTGDAANAVEMFDKALLFFEKVGAPIGQGNVYMRKGIVYFRTGNHSKALEMYDKAFHFFEKVGEPIGQGNVYQSKGDIYLRAGNNSKALEMYDKASIFFKKADEPIGQGNVNFRKGEIYLKSANYLKALETYDKAMSFYEKAGSTTSQGNVYLAKGVIYFYTGYIARALKMYDKALYFFEKAKAPVGQGNVYERKGMIYLHSGNYFSALEMYDKALTFFEKAGVPIGQGNVYFHKGDIYFYIGDNAKALEMYDNALIFYKKGGNQLGQGNVYHGKGDIYLKIGDNSNALDMYEKALVFFKREENPINLGNVYRSIGDYYLRNRNYSNAVKMYEIALELYIKSGNIESECYALHRKAEVFIKQGKKNEALALYESGVSNLEKLRTQTPLSEMKKDFMEKFYERYEDTVLFMLETKFDDKGFKYAELLKARVFLDQMSEGLVGLEKGLKTELKEERDRLVGKLSALSRQMQETDGKEEKKLKELKEEYRRVESEFEDLLIKIRIENPRYAAVNYPKPLSVQDLQKDVLKKGETLLSYFISKEKAYAFIVSKDNFNVKQLKVRENEIKDLVERYLPAIIEDNANNMKRWGSLLYEKLFKPLEKYLEKSGEIIIVPMGELETIPFEFLIVNKKKPGRPVFLLEKYRVKYVQGATLLSILRKHYTRDSISKSFIGFGDPVYDYENFKQGKPEQGSMKILATESTEGIEDEIKEIHRDRYARAGGIMDRLPQSGEETKTIGRLFEKESLKSVVHLREQATETNAKAANMKDFAYIHFSCHGLLSDDFQSLVLSQLPPEKSKEDGYFTLTEIMNCDYNAKLVVLSACQTGKGKMFKGEGVTGLTRAVMYAGTPAVVASLWKVDDTAAKELMIHFYRNMLEKNMDKTEALRQAKLELIKEKKYSSPLFWSAFVMYGE